MLKKKVRLRLLSSDFTVFVCFFYFHSVEREGRRPGVQIGAFCIVLFVVLCVCVCVCVVGVCCVL